MNEHEKTRQWVKIWGLIILANLCHGIPQVIYIIISGISLATYIVDDLEGK